MTMFYSDSQWVPGVTATFMCNKGIPQSSCSYFGQSWHNFFSGISSSSYTKVRGWLLCAATVLVAAPQACLAAVQTVTCQSNGQWSGTAPSSSMCTSSNQYCPQISCSGANAFYSGFGKHRKLQEDFTPAPHGTPGQSPGNPSASPESPS
jgi:hypothetical protein